jgi:hypothetical protein
MKRMARSALAAVAIVATLAACNGSATEGGSGTSGEATETACDPLAPPPITLGAIVGVGKDAGGMLYVDAANGVFVSKSGELVRQHVIGTGQSGTTEFLFSFVSGADESSPRNLLVETQGSTAVKMGLGRADSKAFLNQSPPGVTLLTLVGPSTVSGMKLVNTPNVIEYLADVANGDVLLATMPMNEADWDPTTGGQFIFYGPPGRIAERKITAFEQGGMGEGTLTFLVGQTLYTLNFGPVMTPDSGPFGTFELDDLTPEGGSPLKATLRSPTPATLPAGLSFTCFATQ